MKSFILTALLLVTASFIWAQTDDARKKNFNVKKNIILEGYDAVRSEEHTSELQSPC